MCKVSSIFVGLVLSVLFSKLFISFIVNSICIACHDLYRYEKVFDLIVVRAVCISSVVFSFHFLCIVIV